MKRKNKIIICIIGMIITVLIWFISPMFLPASYYTKKPYCSWNGPCVEAEPIKGLIFTIVLLIIFNIFLIILIKTIIKKSK